jgi:hypothetical protein
MPKSYSPEFLQKLTKLKNDAFHKPGVKLADVCVSANLPMVYVADAFKVSRMSVHSWFRGQYIREKNVNKIQKFIRLVKSDLDIGLLPAPNMNIAKHYLQNHIKDNLMNQ